MIVPAAVVDAELTSVMVTLLSLTPVTSTAVVAEAVALTETDVVAAVPVMTTAPAVVVPWPTAPSTFS